MNVTVTPAKLKGTVTPPPSKSQAHRALIAAALGGGVSSLRRLPSSQDINATLRCLRALGALARWEGDTLKLHGLGHGVRQAPLCPVLDCGESGSTLRFLIPVALVLRGEGVFAGRGRLMERPQAPYFDIFREKGVFWERTGNLLEVKGALSPGEYRLPGDVSSQFVTGLLYALPLLDGDSEIVLTSPLESRGYVDMTLDILGKFGVQVENQSYTRFSVSGNQTFQARDMTVEADWSQAGFWYAAAFLGNAVETAGLDPRSTQGDRVIAAHFETLSRPGDVDIDVSGCPDLVPPLAAMAAVRPGVTRLTNAARLRIKESDRLSAVTRVLGGLGAQVTEHWTSLTVRGRETLAGGVAVDSFNDHRIAMMAAVAAARCEKPVTVTGAECVAKSYPDFWEVYESLGGKIERNG